MKIVVMKNEGLQIDGARLVYRNFEGRGDKFNREGDRNFSVVINNSEDADMLMDLGYKVKIRPPREEGDEPFMHLPVKVYFSEKSGPNVYLKSGSAMNKLDVKTIKCLDNIDIANVDLDIRPYDWEMNGMTGRKAYLESMCVTQNVDRFASRYGFMRSNESLAEEDEDLF